MTLFDDMAAGRSVDVGLDSELSLDDTALQHSAQSAVTVGETSLSEAQKDLMLAIQEARACILECSVPGKVSTKNDFAHLFAPLQKIDEVLATMPADEVAGVTDAADFIQGLHQMLESSEWRFHKDWGVIGREQYDLVMQSDAPGPEEAPEVSDGSISAPPSANSFRPLTTSRQQALVKAVSEELARRGIAETPPDVKTPYADARKWLLKYMAFWPGQADADRKSTPSEEGSISAAPDSAENPGGKPPLTAVEENLPDFLKSMYQRKDYPDQGVTAWYITPASKNVAFLEKKEGLHFDSCNDTNALRAGLMLAKARGWVPAKIEGTPKFCSRAFFEACKLGIPTMGYQPTKEDLESIRVQGIALPKLVASAAPKAAASRMAM